MLEIHKIVVGMMESNCYLVENNSHCLIIDPGDDADFITKKIGVLNLKPISIISTHGHFDHNMAAFEISSNYNIPFYIDNNDIFLIKEIGKLASHWLKRDDVLIPKTKIFKENIIKLDNINLKIIKTPGHTPGSVAFYIKPKNILFSGDLIFKGGGLGRVDFSYSNEDDFTRSLKKILSLPKDTMIYSGHGDEFVLSEFNF